MKQTENKFSVSYTNYPLPFTLRDVKNRLKYAPINIQALSILFNIPKPLIIYELKRLKSHRHQIADYDCDKLIYAAEITYNFEQFSILQELR